MVQISRNDSFSSRLVALKYALFCKCISGVLVRVGDMLPDGPSAVFSSTRFLVRVNQPRALPQPQPAVQRRRHGPGHGPRHEPRHEPWHGAGHGPPLRDNEPGTAVALPQPGGGGGAAGERRGPPPPGAQPRGTTPPPPSPTQTAVRGVAAAPRWLRATRGAHGSLEGSPGGSPGRPSAAPAAQLSRAGNAAWPRAALAAYS